MNYVPTYVFVIIKAVKVAQRRAVWKSIKSLL